MACSLQSEQEAVCYFKNNPGTEENMHSGGEKKFPRGYFLHTGGPLAVQLEAYTAQVSIH